MTSTSTSTPICGFAPISGLPPRAQAMLHRELLLVHVLLAQVHALLHIPLSIRTIPFMSRVTHPQLRAHLEGLDNTLLLALRLNHTAVHYTHELLTALGLLHIIQQSPEQLEDEFEGRTDFGDRAPLSALYLFHLHLLRHRGLPGLTTPLSGCLSLLVLRPLAMYHDLVFTYARDLALALERPDLSLSVSPHTLPDSIKRPYCTTNHSLYTFHLCPVLSVSHCISLFLSSGSRPWDKHLYTLNDLSSR